MDEIMGEQVDILREQMASAISFDVPEGDDMDDGMERMMPFMRHHMRRGSFSYGNFRGDPVGELIIGEDSDFVEFDDEDE